MDYGYYDSSYIWRHGLLGNWSGISTLFEQRFQPHFASFGTPNKVKPYLCSPSLVECRVNCFGR